MQWIALFSLHLLNCQAIQPAIYHRQILGITITKTWRCLALEAVRRSVSSLIARNESQKVLLIRKFEIFFDLATAARNADLVRASAADLATERADSVRRTVLQRVFGLGKPAGKLRTKTDLTGALFKSGAEDKRWTNGRERSSCAHTRPPHSLKRLKTRLIKRNSVVYGLW